MKSQRLRALGFVLVISLSTLLSGGCLTSKSYVDPELPKVSLSDLQARDPRPVVLKVDFRTNGKENLRVTGMVYDQSSAVLRSTGLFSDVVSAGTEMARIEFVMDNVADLGSAVGKGIGTGLTMGLAGSMVTDGYVFIATYYRPDMEPVRKEYKHALHTTIGNKSGPKGLTPLPAQQAFDQMLRELLLKFLKDLQEEGAL